MIVSINVPNKTASIISIPRDTYVKIYNDKNKLTKSRNRINAAFGYGGGLASEDKAFLYAENTVNQFLAQGRIPIDGYVLFDMDFVSSLIDAVGGVDVPVNNLWHDTETFKTDVGIGTITLQNNTTMHMSGKQALAYARDRDHTRGGDQGRVKHQQDVIIALLKNLQSKGNVVKAIPDLFTQFQKDLYTSFNDLNQIAALAGIAQGMKMENVTQYVVTGQGFGVGGASMVVADQTNKAQIVQTVFGLANAADNSWTVGRLQGEINAQLNAGKAIVNTANSFLSNYAGYYSDDEVAALRAAIGEFNAAVSKNDTDAAADAQQDVQDAYNAISPTVTGRKQDVTDLASAISNVKSELNDKKGWMDSSQVSAVQSAIDAARSSKRLCRC
jgi:LCP family protein required for cell wall assembly